MTTLTGTLAGSVSGSLAVSLFLSFFQIGLCSIGGGYAVIPLISRQAVTLEGWITAQEFTDIITISQMTPGPLAVNTSTFVGLRIDGFAGAVSATLGCVLPGLIISLLLWAFFDKFRASAPAQNALDTLRAVSAGLIASAAATILSLVFFPSNATDAPHPAAASLSQDMALSSVFHAAESFFSNVGAVFSSPDFLSEAAFPATVLVAGLWLLRRRHVGPLFIMAGSGLAGAAAYLLR